VSQYTVYVTPSALREVKDLPGHVRQRVKLAIEDLANNPHPPGSKLLDLSDMEVHTEVEREVCRLRIEKWRVLCAITEAEKAIDVLAVRKRPPYDYGDVVQLLEGSE
jgi:mRNA interferase RelE/StbE